MSTVHSSGVHIDLDSNESMPVTADEQFAGHGMRVVIPVVVSLHLARFITLHFQKFLDGSKIISGFMSTCVDSQLDMRVVVQ